MKISRRDFIRRSLASATAVYVTTALTGCQVTFSTDDEKLQNAWFDHGVASGDPLTDSVILWTRATPENGKTETRIAWDIATDKSFTNIIASDTGIAKQAHDFTLKVDVKNLQAGQHYFYRFRSANQTSATGRALTAPSGQTSRLTMAVVSCSNYPAGYFHVYQDIAKAANKGDLDILLHLGDYIYEYAADGYATAQAEALGRVPVPAGEIISLQDYRMRYAQYRSDTDLQAAHAALPFVVVWDDHEITNDTWKNGAENHNEGEGSFAARKEAAIQAYFEWMPIRPASSEDLFASTEIYRNFQWGELANILMLDTRNEGRDEQLSMAAFYNPVTASIDFDSFFAAVKASDRALLGHTQMLWLENQLNTSNATWQILGQQVLMGKMYLPGAVGTQQMSIGQYAEVAPLAVLAQRVQASDPSLTSEEIAYFEANKNKLTDQIMALLQLPSVPYNLDAWDGYHAEREAVYAAAKRNNANLVVLAGDTHNAWASQLVDEDGHNVGVELATASVSSPGLEYYLGVSAEDMPATEAGLVQLIGDLKYVNAMDRGYMTVSFSTSKMTCNWTYVSDIKKPDYQVLTERAKSAKVEVSSANQLQLG
ncbi:alkaline phosphatase D family protein [Gayadomonas joobiniege]|uniref:alkaline phosphatase D family protein n=1 Tax=Gayadomonas joobiniege TaxID=1234606 RepID=UPI00036BC119|nr:alkaline phosphatase D family protein [Gayadomonas joobiniege]